MYTRSRPDVRRNKAKDKVPKRTLLCFSISILEMSWTKWACHTPETGRKSP